MEPGTCGEEAALRLDADQQHRLRLLAGRLGRSGEELLREAVDAYLDRREDRSLPPWVGAWKDGPRTDSSTVKRAIRWSPGGASEPLRLASS